MSNLNISNIKEIDNSYYSIKGKIEKIIQKLRNDYNNSTRENVYYKKVTGMDIASILIIDLILVVLLFIRDKITFYICYILKDDISTNGQDISAFMFWMFLILLLYSIYNTGIIFYCKRIDDYSARIDKVEKKANERFTTLVAVDLLKNVKCKAITNTEYSVDSKNDLGNEILRIKNSLKITNEIAKNVKKILRFVVVAVMFSTLVVYMKKQFATGLNENMANGFKAVMLFLMIMAVVNITQFILGEYLGKYTKIIGFVMTAIYGLLLFDSLKVIYGVQAISGVEGNVFTRVNTISVFVTIIQVFGMVLTICLSRYNLEKEKWINGFEVAMEYRFKNKGNKITLLLRGTVSLVLALGLVFMIAEKTPVEAGAGNCVAYGVLWYLSNTLLKPRGSYLYTFWGRGRAIANEVVMAGALFTGILLTRGTIELKELGVIVIIIAISFVTSSITKIINNSI